MTQTWEVSLLGLDYILQEKTVITSPFGAVDAIRGGTPRTLE